MTRVNAMFTARGYQLKNVWLSNVIMSEWGREVKRTRNVGLKGVRASRSRLWLTQSVLANFGGSAVDLSGNDAMLSGALPWKRLRALTPVCLLSWSGAVPACCRCYSRTWQADVVSTHALGSAVVRRQAVAVLAHAM